MLKYHCRGGGTTSDDIGTDGSLGRSVALDLSFDDRWKKPFFDDQISYKLGEVYNSDFKDYGQYENILRTKMTL